MVRRLALATPYYDPRSTAQAHQPVFPSLSSQDNDEYELLQGELPVAVQATNVTALLHGGKSVALALNQASRHALGQFDGCRDIVSSIT